MNSSRIFVGNLNPSVTEEDLKNKFSDYGNIKNIEVKSKLDIEGDPISKFAYVTLECKASEIYKCVSTLNGSTLKKSIIKVEAARESFLERLKREREQNANKQNQNSQNFSSKSYDSTNIQNASWQARNGSNFKESTIKDKHAGKYFERYKMEGEQNAIQSYKVEQTSCKFPSQSYDSLNILRTSLKGKNDLANGNEKEYPKRKFETDPEYQTQEFNDQKYFKYGSAEKRNKFAFSTGGHIDSDASGNLNQNRNLGHSNQAQFSDHHETTSSHFSLLAMCGRLDHTKSYNRKNGLEEGKETPYFDRANQDTRFSHNHDFQEPIKKKNKSKREKFVLDEPTKKLDKDPKLNDDRKFFINPDDPDLEAGVEWLLTRPLATEIINKFNNIRPSLIEICRNLRKGPSEKLKSKSRKLK